MTRYTCHNEGFVVINGGTFEIASGDDVIMSVSDTGEIVTGGFGGAGGMRGGKNPATRP